MKRTPPRGLTKPSLAALLLSVAATCSADWQLNMTEGVTPISRQAYDLHMTVLLVCCVIGVGVFGAMFWSILHHRKSLGAKAAHFHESTTVEVLWTLIPFLILVGLAVPATRALIDIEDASDADMSILVTGYQWKWHYKYLEDDLAFYSTLSADSNAARQLGSGADVSAVPNYLLDVDRPVVVPVRKKIRFLTTANDVIHAWWVPALGFKRDAIPGFVNESWAYIEQPGTYRGQCAELCGRDHGFMPIVVVAKEEADYRAWVAAEKATLEAAARAADPNREWTGEELVAEGANVYGRTCASCHGANGEGVSGQGPALTGSELALGAIEDHVDLVMFGAPDKGKKGYADELNDAQVAAVVTYTRNAIGNAAGDSIQPSAVKDFR